jgi:hypothetical protein
MTTTTPTRTPARTSTRTSAAPSTDRVVLDWSGLDGELPAWVGPTAPCQYCRRPALLRHPVTRRPCHKVCAEAAINARRSSRTPAGGA